MSDAFQQELATLGIESSPAFGRAPEGNACAERLIRTLKENLLWVRTFDTVEELRQALVISSLPHSSRSENACLGSGALVALDSKGKVAILQNGHRYMRLMRE